MMSREYKVAWNTAWLDYRSQSGVKQLSAHAPTDSFAWEVYTGGFINSRDDRAELMKHSGYVE